MKNFTHCSFFGLFLAVGFTASAQTLYVPGGTVGTSSYGNVGIGGDEAGKAFAITAADTSNQIGGSLAGIHIVNSNASAANRVTEITFGGRTRHHKPFAAVSGVLVADHSYEQSGSLVFSTKGTADASYPLERVRIRYDGNVGIGTTNPQYELDVVGSVRLTKAIPVLSVRDSDHTHSSSGVAGYVSFQDSNGVEYGWIGDGSLGNNYISMFAGSNHGIQFGSGGAAQMWISTSGNVGIGTSTPSHKLAVNGTIRAKEIIVDSGWADYVFAEDYDLASLSEVEAHIEENGHLPDIPSANDVTENGVSLGEMQSLLLAKIEELTLHQIRQEKSITRLSEENRTLRHEVQSLKQQVP